MESSQTLLRLGHIRAPRRHRSFSRCLSLPIRNATRACRRHLLPVLLLPLPTILHLRNIRLLLDSQMANLSMERRMGLSRKILAIPRRILQHHPRTIRQGRDHERTVRTVDARPTTTQLRPIDLEMGLSSFHPHQSAIRGVLLCP
jgi:hypothetical protein